eukprot:scaffold3708_cov107-Amphora_coffeaeformis.AAC.2
MAGGRTARRARERQELVVGLGRLGKSGGAPEVAKKTAQWVGREYGKGKRRRRVAKKGKDGGKARISRPRDRLQ